MRVAIYYAPELDDPLWSAGCSWLGRDPERAAQVTQPKLENIEHITATARGYGFHCTLKPPMVLATSYPEFREDLANMVQAIGCFDLPPLEVIEISGFLALCAVESSPALQALADICVSWLDKHRQAPLTSELERRRGAGLSSVEDALLRRWGYPGVFSHWRFHMTLTRSLSKEDVEVWRPAAQQHFDASVRERRQVRSVCIFTQPAPDVPFRLAERLPLA